MATRMLIDAAHLEETRVAVVTGNRLDDFDIESEHRRPLKGNIYLAKVTRVEPSLQAAFVEYGGNRHGFIPFAEIHPDYYQIPVADRQALLEAEAREARDHDDDDQPDTAARPEIDVPDMPVGTIEAPLPTAETASQPMEPSPVLAADLEPLPPTPPSEPKEDEATPAAQPPSDPLATIPIAADASPAPLLPGPAVDVGFGAPETDSPLPATESASGEEPLGEAAPEPIHVEALGGAADAADEVPRPRVRRLRSYKIQEVIKRRQIMLIQVVKEERGNKGAALTTYISLAGRYCVLMPNSPRGGGISRKIVDAQDRRRLKEVVSGLDVPEGMGVILRTAGMQRAQPEIKRDFEYLLRLWDGIRDLTLKSTAPALIYEEANLIKRSIRDLFHQGIEEVLVEGEDGYRAARDFVRQMMPSMEDKVRAYRDRVPVFQRFQVEQILEGIHNPTVQLKSGGYIVFGQTEALVAIDVNSGRATRERHIEDTALRTNLEAADEVARQLRLRDLAGLIVIDFIDMDSGGNNRAVERRLKEALKSDRARIQVGRISPFGLLEMSRQRLRPSLLESMGVKCPHCAGTGYLRSTESSALSVLREIEEEIAKSRSAEIVVHVPEGVALYLLNAKRGQLHEFEQKYGMRIVVQADDSLVPPDCRIERSKPRQQGGQPQAPRGPIMTPDAVSPPPEAAIEAGESVAAAPSASDLDAAHAAALAENEAASSGQAVTEGGERDEHRRGRRRRRGRGRERHDRGQAEAPLGVQPIEGETDQAVPSASEGQDAVQPPGDIVASSGRPTDDRGEGGERSSRRRRGRRGGRRFRERDQDIGQRPEGEGQESPRPFMTPDQFASEMLNRPPAYSPPPPAPPAPPAVEAAPLPPPPPPSPSASEAPPPPAESEGPPKPRKTGWWSRMTGGAF
ncbi:MAG: ribonuclease E/G [Alphaproteobacteria bacterium]|nr:ribonuclease E/G [Alphaproteobacteria bacterium]